MKGGCVDKGPKTSEAAELTNTIESTKAGDSTDSTYLVDIFDILFLQTFVFWKEKWSVNTRNCIILVGL